MIMEKRLILTFCISLGICGAANAETAQNKPRGQLLYETYCIACHTAEIHWREKKLATDWKSLIDEVRRWQASIGQNWTESEIKDVADYLNAIHYGFPVTEKRRLSQSEKSGRPLRHD